jgi:tetratricopeptide (TPR) repeat protein
MNSQADSGTGSWRDAGSPLLHLVFVAGLIVLTACMVAGLVQAVALQGGLPSASHLYQRFALALYSAGDVDAAIAEYRGEQRVNHNLTGSGVALYRMLVQAGRPDEAIEAIRRATERSTHATVHADYATLLVEAGRTDEGFAAFQRALRLEPKNAAIRVRLGLLLESQGRFAEAAQAYQAAAELDPALTEARFRLRELERRTPAESVPGGSDAAGAGLR